VAALHSCGPSRTSTRYGALGPADGNDLQLPTGYRSRVVARSGQRVGTTQYVWHKAPDGGHCFAVPGGWAYVSNCEHDPTGGVGMVRFDSSGAIVGAARLLDGTRRNCAGGHTPWGTWLSCEEVERGRVFEVDPLGVRAPVVHRGMGRFSHEGAAVDESRRTVYLSEDAKSGLLYRYRYERAGDLSTGVLEAAKVDNGVVSWLPVPDPSARTTPTRQQVPGATPFRGGEGIWYERDVVNLATKFDDRIWAYDVVTGRLSLLYDWAANPLPVLRGVDNLCRRGGDLFVCEDMSILGHPADPEVCVVEPDGVTSVFLRAVGHRTSELTGASFNPAGDRLYLSSQRGTSGSGVTFEITGPFPS
jgi:secreted PhoX family phosphatase